MSDSGRAGRLKRLKRQKGAKWRTGQRAPLSPQAALVLDAVKDHRKPVSLMDLSKELGMARKAGRLYLWRKLALLTKHGKVKRVERGVYQAIK